MCKYILSRAFDLIEVDYGDYLYHLIHYTIGGVRLQNMVQNMEDIIYIFVGR